MGGSRQQKNKAHKTKFSAKSQRNKHKLSKEAVPGSNGVSRSNTLTQGYAAGAKTTRILRNKQVREQKRNDYLQEKRASSGNAAPPRILVLLALSAEVDVQRIKSLLVEACGALDANGSIAEVDGDAVMDTEGDKATVSLSANGTSRALTVAASRYKIRFTIIEVKYGDTLQCLEAIKVADIIASLVPSGSGPHVDAWGHTCLSLVRSQGCSASLGLLQSPPLPSSSAKKKAEGRKAAMAALGKEMGKDCKGLPCDSPAECQQVLRHLADQRVAAPAWRVQRPYVVAHQVDYVPNEATPGVGTLFVSGYLRGRSISVNQLVHVAGQGDFQMSHIHGPTDPFPLSGRQRGAGVADVAMGEASAEVTPPLLAAASAELAEALVVKNTPDPLAGDQTWPTEDELAAAGKKQLVKRVPKGTSSYQAAWYIGESEGDSEGSEGEEEDGDDVAMAGDGGRDESSAREGEEGGEQEGEEEEEEEEEEEWEEVETGGGRSASRATSVWGDDHTTLMEEDEGMTDEQREEDLRRIRSLRQQQDQEFPDEVDTPSDVPARQRFAKFRGLKSFRTSPWDPKESLPLDYSYIFAFENFKRTRKHVLSRMADIDAGRVEGSVRVGTFVRLQICNVPQNKADSASLDTLRGLPLVAVGLLPHESKLSVVHYGIRKAESFQQPIRSKEPLLFHAGFRRFTTKPIYSTDDLNLDKHKFERFLHPGRFCVASIYAPITFGPIPLLAFSQQGDQVQLAASGSLREADPDRVVLKKIILSGYPLSVSKRKAVVKYMFHNADDVRWFKPVELYTKYGRRGRIKEPVGEKGNMKCIFDGVVQQRDTVCLSLYKRIYPKWPEDIV